MFVCTGQYGLWFNYSISFPDVSWIFYSNIILMLNVPAAIKFLSVLPLTFLPRLRLLLMQYAIMYLIVQKNKRNKLTFHFKGHRLPFVCSITFRPTSLNHRENFAEKIRHRLVKKPIKKKWFLFKKCYWTSCVWGRQR